MKKIKQLMAELSSMKTDERTDQKSEMVDQPAGLAHKLQGQAAGGSRNCYEVFNGT